MARGTEHNLILEEAGIPRIRHRVYSLKLAEFYQRSLLSSDAAVDPPNQALETGGMDFIWRAQFLNSYFEWEHLLWCMTYADHPCKSSLSTFARTLTWSLKVFEQNCSVIFSRSQRRWYFNDAHLGFWVLELIGDA